MSSIKECVDCGGRCIYEPRSGNALTRCKKCFVKWQNRLSDKDLKLIMFIANGLDFSDIYKLLKYNRKNYIYPKIRKIEKKIGAKGIAMITRFAVQNNLVSKFNFKIDKDMNPNPLYTNEYQT